MLNRLIKVEVQALSLVHVQIRRESWFANAYITFKDSSKSACVMFWKNMCHRPAYCWSYTEI